MKKEDKNKFYNVFRYLSLNFPDRAVDEGLFESYFNDLSKYDISDIEIAAKTHVATKFNFPFVADLCRLLPCQDKT